MHTQHKLRSRPQPYVIALLLSIIGSVGAAHADCGGTQPGLYCSDVRVTDLYVTADGPVYVKVSGNMAALQPHCSLVAGTYIVLGNTLPNFKMLYTTLLAAQAQSKNTMVRITPNDTTCSIAYVIIN